MILPASQDYSVTNSDAVFAQRIPEGTLILSSTEYSEWHCHLFGGIDGDGLTWTPLKGKEPNRFWRWMQYLCFGNRWVKTSQP